MGGRDAEDEKNNSFGDGLREPKPSFSFVFSLFPWPGRAWAPGGAQEAREAWSPLGEPGSDELGERSAEPGGGCIGRLGSLYSGCSPLFSTGSVGIGEGSSGLLQSEGSQNKHMVH